MRAQEALRGHESIRKQVSPAMQQLKLGVPKGSLEAATIELFRKSGWKISGNERSYFPSVDDETLRCVLARPQEMSRYVEDGTLDAGITGKDWTLENDSDVRVVSDFIYSKTSMRPTRWVLVVARDSEITEISQLAGKRIATEMVGFTKRYFAERHIDVDVEFSWGATEAKVAEGLVDAIVEVTETGSTIRAHGLKIIHDLCESNPQLIANHAAWADPWKREKIEQISLLLNGALQAEAKVGLKMNVGGENLEAIIKMIPSITAPTVSPLYGTQWFAVESVISEAVVRELIPQLLKNGAVGIIEYPLNKVI
jgi:ATP phosphoribosyltransferase